MIKITNIIRIILVLSMMIMFSTSVLSNEVTNVWTAVNDDTNECGVIASTGSLPEELNNTHWRMVAKGWGLIDSSFDDKTKENFKKCESLGYISENDCGCNQLDYKFIGSLIGKGSADLQSYFDHKNANNYIPCPNGCSCDDKGKIDSCEEIKPGKAYPIDVIDVIDDENNIDKDKITTNCPIGCICEGNIITCPVKNETNNIETTPGCPVGCQCDSKGNAFFCEVKTCEPCPVGCNCECNTGNIIKCEENSPPTLAETCGELIYFCSLDSPYCELTNPIITQYIESDTCVHVTKNIIDSFMNLPKNEVALKYSITYVPAFVFIDKNGCFGEIGNAGNTKLGDIKRSVANFKCGINSSSPSIPECPTYTCEGGFKQKCEIINNHCSCEACPSIPIKPNSTSGPIEIPTVNSTTINYQCNGCSLDNKCYPFGYRKDGNYCSDSEKFEEQLNSNNICENNFECSSNVCISGKCISESFIQKVLNWFSRLFSAD